MLLLVTVGLYAPAQQNDDNCFAGNHAVFVYNSLPPDTVAFYLQRREKEGDTRWVTIRTYRSPNGAAEGLSAVGITQRHVPPYGSPCRRSWDIFG